MGDFLSNIGSGISSLLGHDITAIGGGYSAITEILKFAIQPLPDGGGLPQGVHDAAIYFGNLLAKVNFILPVDVLVSCLVIILSLKITMYGIHIFIWFMNFIRGIPTPKFGGWAPAGGSVEPGYSTVAERTRKFWGE